MSVEALSELRKVLSEGRTYEIQKGQVILSTEDREVFNYISSGFVKRYLISHKGDIGVQIIYGPGDFFPLSRVYKVLFNQDLYKGPEIYYYEAMTDLELSTIDAAELKEKVTGSMLLHRALLIEAGKRLETTLWGLENIMMENSQKRVAHQLAYYARHFGKKTSKGVEIKIPLTHQDLADILSVARETVSPAMKQLRKEGLIKTNRHIVVPNINKLEKEAYTSE